jgi:hypothetical protein
MLRLKYVFVLSGLKSHMIDEKWGIPLTDQKNMSRKSLNHEGENRSQLVKVVFVLIFEV